jgi:hypothetical protein
MEQKSVSAPSHRLDALHALLVLVSVFLRAFPSASAKSPARWKWSR